uniref:Inner membrane translocon protein Ycf1 n=1 Tax=Rhopalocnemis phalloides TaxID=1128106 RepID=A0A8K1XM29_9MAGN|nr:inner membrane translocon protein Ycf1 [Rhopalocnemis phalloides]
MIIKKKIILNIFLPIILIILFSKFYYWVLFLFNFENRNFKKLYLNEFLIDFLNNYIILFLFLIIYYIPIYLDYIYLINIFILLYFIFLLIFKNNNINNTIIIKFLFFNNIIIQLIKYSFIYNILIIRILHNYLFRFIYKFNILIFIIYYFIYFYLLKYLLYKIINYKYIFIFKLKINNILNNLIKKYYNFYYIYYILYFINIFINYIFILKNLYIIICFFIIFNYLEIITFFYKFNMTPKQEIKQFVHNTKFGKIKFNIILCFETLLSDLFLSYKKNKEPLRYQFIKNFIIKEVSQFFFYEIYQIDGLKRFSFTYPYNLSYFFEFLKKHYKIKQYNLNTYYLREICFKLIKLFQLNDTQIQFNNIIIQNSVKSEIYYIYDQIDKLNNFNINYSTFFLKNNKEIEEDNDRSKKKNINKKKIKKTKKNNKEIDEDENEIDEEIEEDNDRSKKKNINKKKIKKTKKNNKEIDEDENEIDEEIKENLNINKLYIIFLKIFNFNNLNKKNLNKNNLIINKINDNIVINFIYSYESHKNFVKYIIYLKKIYKKRYQLIFNKIKKTIINIWIVKRIKIRKSIEIKSKNYSIIKLFMLSEVDPSLKLQKNKDKLIYLRQYHNVFNFLRNLAKGSSRNKRRKVNIYNLIQLNLKSLLFQFIYKIYKKKNYSKIIKKKHQIKINQFLQYIPFIYLINTFLLLFQLNFRKYIKLPLIIYIKCKIFKILFKIDDLKKNMSQLKMEKYIYCTCTGIDFSEKYFPKNWLSRGLQIKIISPFYFNSINNNKTYFLTIFGGLKQHILLINTKKKYNKINFLKKQFFKIKFLFIFIIYNFINNIFKIFKFNKTINYKKFYFNFNNSFLQSYILYCILKSKYNIKYYYKNCNQFDFIKQKNKKKNYNYFYNNIFDYIFVHNLDLSEIEKKNIIKNTNIINKNKITFLTKKNYNYFYNNIFDLSEIEKKNLKLLKKKKNKIINQIKLNYVLRDSFNNELKLYYILIKAMNKKYLISMINLQNIQINLLNQLNNKNENINIIYNFEIEYNYYNHLVIKQCIQQNVISLIFYNNYNTNKFYQQILLFIYFKNLNEHLRKINNLNFINELNLKLLYNFSHTIFSNSIFEDLIFINIIINKFYLFKLKI